MITKISIIKLLEEEIKWCEDNTGFLPTEEEKAFISGIKQSIRLIKKLR